MKTFRTKIQHLKRILYSFNKLIWVKSCYVMSRVKFLCNICDIKFLFQKPIVSIYYQLYNSIQSMLIMIINPITNSKKLSRSLDIDLALEVHSLKRCKGYCQKFVITDR